MFFHLDDLAHNLWFHFDLEVSICFITHLHSKRFLSTYFYFIKISAIKKYSLPFNTNIYRDVRLYNFVHLRVKHASFGKITVYIFFHFRYLYLSSSVCKHFCPSTITVPYFLPFVKRLPFPAHWKTYLEDYILVCIEILSHFRYYVFHITQCFKAAAYSKNLKTKMIDLNTLFNF